MSDAKQTLSEREQQQQHASPGAQAPGEAAAERERQQAAPGDARPAAGPAPEQAADAAAGASPAEAQAPEESAAEQAWGEGAEEVQGDLDELVKTAAERDEYLALAQRTQADFDNYRKRVARESAGAQQRGVAALVKELLPALDNLDRALTEASGGAGADGEGEDPLLAGVRLVRSELSAALARMGVESFSPTGEAFDPSKHEAVATAEQSDDGCASGTVVEVYQAGYRLGDSVIRPARVVVCA